MTPKAKLLIVDDDAPFRFVLAKSLETDGYEVKTAANGCEALELVDQEEFDLIMIDLIMPGQDGFETIHALRENYGAMPIIVMSGGWTGGSQSYLRLAGKIGECPTLAKPFTRDDMLKAISSELNGRRDGLPETD